MNWRTANKRRTNPRKRYWRTWTATNRIFVHAFGKGVYLLRPAPKSRLTEYYVSTDVPLAIVAAGFAQDAQRLDP